MKFVISEQMNESFFQILPTLIAILFQPELKNFKKPISHHSIEESKTENSNERNTECYNQYFSGSTRCKGNKNPSTVV